VSSLHIPKCLSYHGYNFPGFADLKKIPPIPVTSFTSVLLRSFPYAHFANLVNFFPRHSSCPVIEPPESSGKAVNSCIRQHGNSFAQLIVRHERQGAQAPEEDM